jgi:hypothetical protein
MRSKVKIKRDTRQFVNQAWVRNGDSAVTGEALILVLLLHSTGASRGSKDWGNDFKVVQTLMDDVNLDEE